MKNNIPSKEEREKNQEQTKQLVTDIVTSYTDSPILSSIATSVAMGAISVAAKIFGNDSVAGLLETVSGSSMSKHEAQSVVKAAKGEISTEEVALRANVAIQSREMKGGGSGPDFSSVMKSTDFAAVMSSGNSLSSFSGLDGIAASMMSPGSTPAPTPGNTSKPKEEKEKEQEQEQSKEKEAQPKEKAQEAQSKEQPTTHSFRQRINLNLEASRQAAKDHKESISSAQEAKNDEAEKRSSFSFGS